MGMIHATRPEVEEEPEEAPGRRTVSESRLPSLLHGFESRENLLRDHAEWLDAFQKREDAKMKGSSSEETALSVGSRLHPDGCTPCSFFCYSLSGCNRGEECTFCHHEHLRRPRRRGKKKRGEKEKDTED